MPQGPGQPWWRYDNPDQAPAGASYPEANYGAGASYQAPPVYPGSYQAPPGLPGPQPARPPGSRKPLIYGLIAGLVAAAVAAGALVLTHHPAPATPAGRPSTQAAGQPTSPPATTQSPATSPREQAAQALSGLLTQSVTDRSSIVAAVADVGDCGPTLKQDPQTLEGAAVSRQNLLKELASLPGRSALPQNLLTALTGAWQNSMKADQAYAQWAQDENSSGCTKNDTSDPNYQAAIGPDGQATVDKQAFVNLWNPIGTQYGLPTYQWSEL